MSIPFKFRMMFGRRVAYRHAFLDDKGQLTEAGQRVMADLAKFCRVRESITVVSPITRTVDTHASMQAEGRREVFNRLSYYLNLSEQDIFQLMEREHARPE
ncbi:hypothetical protein [Achromobacter marplatensis]|jgi:phosphohistidine phosphatase SixA|uniref:Bbp19 family protein n=1 Tax=Achromobacter marplatensis TaxID=470868 RepID=UPI003CFDE2AA